LFPLLLRQQLWLLLHHLRHLPCLLADHEHIVVLPLSVTSLSGQRLSRLLLLQLLILSMILLILLLLRQLLNVVSGLKTFSHF
jgi:hypothetical protein